MYLKHVQRRYKKGGRGGHGSSLARPQLSIELSSLSAPPSPHHPAWGFLSKIGQQLSSNTCAHSAPQPIMLTLSCAPENETRRPEIPALCSIFHICMLKPSEPCHPAAVSVKGPLLPSLHHTAPTVPTDVFHHLLGTGEDALITHGRCSTIDF